ncbi:hypothetical protein O6H91_Y532800 [Diphasiastrum complanatum]|nr:hypothetical protein O6H91_Y532800 [Diphasiastrum complanatum]
MLPIARVYCSALRMRVSCCLMFAGKEVVTANSLKQWHPGSRILTCRVQISARVQEPVQDEKWEKERREESKELQRRRREEEKEEQTKVEEYRQIAGKLQNFPQEDVRRAKRLVASLILAGEDVEEMIVEAGKNGDLSPLVLLVIKNRLELAQRDDERDAMQAFDLLYRRIENEMMQKEASLELRFLNELLSLHDGFSHEEWLQRARRSMLDVFAPENAFTVLAFPGFDLTNV